MTPKMREEHGIWGYIRVDVWYDFYEMRYKMGRWDMVNNTLAYNENIKKGYLTKGSKYVIFFVLKIKR